MTKYFKIWTVFIMILCIGVCGSGLQRKCMVIKAATFGEQNALAKAHSYLDFSAFSKSGLKKQLKFEGFSNKEAKYAVNNCGANWKKQALYKAKETLLLKYGI